MTPPLLTTRQITPLVHACPFLHFNNYSLCIKAFYTIQKAAYKSIRFYLLNIKILKNSKTKINPCTSVTPQLGELSFQICFRFALMLPAAVTFVSWVGGEVFPTLPKVFVLPRSQITLHLKVWAFVCWSYNKQLWMYEKLITTGKKQKLASRFCIYNGQKTSKHIIIPIYSGRFFFPFPSPQTALSKSPKTEWFYQFEHSEINSLGAQGLSPSLHLK